MNEPTARSYDPDTFDWDDKGQASIDASAVEKVENLIQQALGAIAPGNDAWLRPSKVDNDRARITYNVAYALRDDQKKYLEELVGDTRTLTYNANSYHDHPISHCVTEISEDIVVRKFGGQPFVSVYGNQSRHQRMGHSGAKVVSTRIVPHDWFRNRGHEEVVTDINNFVDQGGHKNYRLFLGTHVLYYMSLDDVAHWLGGNRDAEFYAIVHRHNKSHGHLNKGELKYTTDESGYVTQTNPVTGLAYGHRSLEPLFHSDSCRVHGGETGLAWDINIIAGDTYLIKFVLCDVESAKEILDPFELVKTDRSVYVRGDVTVYRCLSFEWYVYHGPNERTLLEDVELYDRLRTIIAGKERTPRAKADLMSMCRRLANKNDVISIHQGYHHDVAPELLTDYVNAAFYADIKHELEVAILYHRENKRAVDALNAFYAETKVPTDLTIIANVGRAVATPFLALGGLLKDRPPVKPPTCLVDVPLRQQSTYATSPFSRLPTLPPPPLTRAAVALKRLMELPP